MEFECTTCHRMFSSVVFDLSREYDRVIYRRPSAFDEVAVADAEGIASFCSQDCRSRGTAAVMAEQQVPIPMERPGIEPAESCAKCKGDVDMSDWHLTFVEAEADFSKFGVEMSNLEYLAVVCRRCAPRRKSTEAFVGNETAGANVQ